MEEFKCLGVLFMNEGKRRVGISSDGSVEHLQCSGGCIGLSVSKGFDFLVNLHSYCTYGHKLWVANERMGY